MVKRAYQRTTRKKSPEEYLLGTLEQWEEAVFRNANHFTVYRYPSKQSTLHQTFADAIAAAKDDERALVCAVTFAGRFFCVPRAQWNQYLAVGRDRS